MIEKILNDVEEGNVNPLIAYIELHKLIVKAQDALDKIKEAAIDEAYKYPEKSIEINGVIVEKRNTPTRWDYSECETIKQVNEYLQKLQKIAQNGGVDPQTGELLRAKKIEGKTTIAIKLLIK